MALHEFEVQSHAIDVAFNADTSLIAVLHSRGIAIFEWKDVTVPSTSPKLTGRVTFRKGEDQQPVYQQICFVGTNEVLVMKRSEDCSVVERYGFDDDTGRMELTSSEPTSTPIACTLSSYFQDGAVYPYVQGKAGDLHSLTSTGQSLSHCKFPSSLPWVDIWNGDGPIAFGMSGNGHLYANSRLLVKNCTSFLVTPAHLILTTTAHLLKFVHITNVNGMNFSSYFYNIANSNQIWKSPLMTQRKMSDAGALSVVLG